MLIKHPWNGIDQEVEENSLEQLILQCGQYFDTLEIRNDGWVTTGHVYRPDQEVIRLKGKGDTMKEAIQDLLNQIKEYVHK